MKDNFGPEVLAASNERHRTANVALSRERHKSDKDSKVSKFLS